MADVVSHHIERYTITGLIQLLGSRYPTVCLLSSSASWTYARYCEDGMLQPCLVNFETESFIIPSLATLGIYRAAIKSSHSNTAIFNLGEAGRAYLKACLTRLKYCLPNHDRDGSSRANKSWLKDWRNSREVVDVPLYVIVKDSTPIRNNLSWFGINSFFHEYESSTSTRHRFRPRVKEQHFDSKCKIRSLEMTSTLHLSVEIATNFLSIFDNTDFCLPHHDPQFNDFDFFPGSKYEEVHFHIAMPVLDEGYMKGATPGTVYKLVEMASTLPKLGASLFELGKSLIVDHYFGQDEASRAKYWTVRDWIDTSDYTWHMVMQRKAKESSSPEALEYDGLQYFTTPCLKRVPAIVGRYVDDLVFARDRFTRSWHLLLVLQRDRRKCLDRRRSNRVTARLCTSKFRSDGV
ncbi:hypothetical protein EK21DRAFT_90878 [Setomelanomma holmii]|uniref:Uncharacterized protein n=1 Tax=Setomelanomma holmii TaxID=210430 RepID=A0A9P4LL08_9PLEO|nr:hypothetical protein EK21DRAFT_90878 [Setomelanomma holmii]